MVPPELPPVPVEPVPPEIAETVEAAEAPRRGILRLTTVPWAEVYVDRKRVGRTPRLTEIELEPGAHRLRLVNPRRLPHLETVEVEAGQVLKKRIRLKPLE